MSGDQLVEMLVANAPPVPTWWQPKWDRKYPERVDPERVLGSSLPHDIKSTLYRYIHDLSTGCGTHSLDPRINANVYKIIREAVYEQEENARTYSQDYEEFRIGTWPWKYADLVLESKGYNSAKTPKSSQV